MKTPTLAAEPSLSKNDIMDVVLDLRDNFRLGGVYHAVDQILCTLEKIVFTDNVAGNSLPIAAISLKDNDITLFINPKTFLQLNKGQKRFVIIHEVSHILCDRFEFLKREASKGNHKLSNIALDLPINILLTETFTHGYFGGNTLFNPPLDKIITRESFNSLFPPERQCFESITSETAYFKLGTLESPPSFTKIGLDITGEDDLETKKETVRRIVSKIDKDTLERMGGLAFPGSAGNGESEFQKQLNKKKSNLLVNSLIEIAHKITLSTGRKHQLIEEESWAHPSRRSFNLTSNSKLFLPGTAKLPLKRKLRALVLIDISGSCREVSPVFIQLARAIPKEYYDTFTYLFDIRCHRVKDLNNTTNIRFGGGTSYDDFASLEQELKPDIAMVFTDGHGTRLNLKSPHLWYFFLTKEFSLNYLPRKVKLFTLSNNKFKYLGVKKQ